MVGLTAFGLLSGGTCQAGLPNTVTYVGALLGVAAIQDGGNHLPYGLTTGYRLTPEWGTGVLFSHYAAGAPSSALPTGVSPSSPDEANRGFTVLAAELNYYFAGTWDGLHIGGKAGFAFAGGAPIDGTSLNEPTLVDGALGPAVAYDYGIGPVTVGAEANYLLLTRRPASSLFQCVVVVKYNFI